MEKPLRIVDGDGLGSRYASDPSALQRALAVRVDATMCDRSQALLALLAELDDVPRRYMPAQRRAIRHVNGCLRCQRDLAFARSARTAVATLKDQVLASSMEDVADVLAAIDDLGEVIQDVASRALYKRPAVVAVASIAVVAGVAGGVAVAWHLRRRATYVAATSV